MTDLEATLRGALERLEFAPVSDADVAAFEADEARRRAEERLEASGIAEVLTREMRIAILRHRLKSTWSQAAVKEWLLALKNRPGKTRPILGLLGGIGVGKTVAAAWGLARVPGRYLSAEELVVLHGSRWGAPRERLERCVRTELLVVDEVGVLESVEEEAAALHYVLDRRQSLPRKTLLLGNVDQDAFYARLNARTVSRLIQSANLAAAKGPNLRGTL